MVAAAAASRASVTGPAATLLAASMRSAGSSSALPRSAAMAMAVGSRPPSARTAARSSWSCASAASPSLQAGCLRTPSQASGAPAWYCDAFRLFAGAPTSDSSTCVGYETYQLGLGPGLGLGLGLGLVRVVVEHLRRRSVPSGHGLRRRHVSPTLRAGEEHRGRIVPPAPFGQDGMAVLAQAQAAAELVESVLVRPAGPSSSSSSKRGGASSRRSRGDSRRSSSRRRRRRSSRTWWISTVGRRKSARR